LRNLAILKKPVATKGKGFQSSLEGFLQIALVVIRKIDEVLKLC